MFIPYEETAIHFKRTICLMKNKVKLTITGWSVVAPRTGVVHDYAGEEGLEEVHDGHSHGNRNFETLGELYATREWRPMSAEYFSATTREHKNNGIRSQRQIFLANNGREIGSRKMRSGSREIRRVYVISP